MLLWPQSQVSLADIVRLQLPDSFLELIGAAFGAVRGFAALHSLGLCSRDISFGKLLMDPQSKVVAIFDHDNEPVDGETFSGVLGTPRFLAPEILTDGAKPTIQTDLYSLAVLLFCLLVAHRPLEGRREMDDSCLD